MNYYRFLILSIIIIIPAYSGEYDYEVIRMCLKSKNYEDCREKFGTTSYPNKIKGLYESGPMPIKITPYKG